MWHEPERLQASSRACVRTAPEAAATRTPEMLRFHETNCPTLQRRRRFSAESPGVLALRPAHRAAARDAATRIATICALAAVTAVTALSGCNNAHVLRGNYDRTMEARREAAETPRTAQREKPKRLFPPFKRTESGDDYGQRPTRRAETDGPAFPTLQPARDDDESDGDEIQQMSGEFPASSGAIVGRVVDGNGRPQRGVSVVATATRRPGGGRLNATTDGRGSFAFRGLEPGQRYLILATATKSATPLIGRVATTAPDQDVVIPISPPFTASRSNNAAARDVARPSQPATTGSAPPRQQVPPGAPRLANSSPRSGPVSSQRPATSSPAAPMAAPTPARKQTMQEVIADNRVEPPWDMPAPPQRRTPPPHVAATTPANSPSSEWQPAGRDRKVFQGTKLGNSLLDPLPTDTAPLDATASRENSASNVAHRPVGQMPLATSSQAPPPTDPTIDPRHQPLSQPLDITAEPRDNSPTGPKSAPTKSLVELEPSEPLNYTGPMCEFDGSRLVEFQLPDLDGRPVAFTRLRGRVVLVDFWTTWCGPCLKAMPHLVNLQRRYGPQGLQVVGVTCEQGQGKERFARVAQINEQLSINYPLLLDDGNEKFLVRDKFGVGIYPTLILLDKTGKVLWRCEGPDQKDLQQLEKLLKTQLASGQKSL